MGIPFALVHSPHDQRLRVFCAPVLLVALFSTLDAMCAAGNVLVLATLALGRFTPLVVLVSAAVAVTIIDSLLQFLDMTTHFLHLFLPSISHLHHVSIHHLHLTYKCICLAVIV